MPNRIKLVVLPQSFKCTVPVSLSWSSGSPLAGKSCCVGAQPVPGEEGHPCCPAVSSLPEPPPSSAFRAGWHDASGLLYWALFSPSCLGFSMLDSLCHPAAQIPDSDAACLYELYSAAWMGQNSGPPCCHSGVSSQPVSGCFNQRFQASKKPYGMMGTDEVYISL